MPPVYFSVDDSLLYNAFHHDFGPLHIGHLYRFAVQLHDILGDPLNEGRGVVFWSKADSRSKRPLGLPDITAHLVVRSSQRSVSAGLLHGPHSVLATPSSAGPHRSD